MAQLLINIGAAPNDLSGDPLRVAYDKSNQNFTELYNRLSADELAAIHGANLPSALNPFATMSDLGSFITDAGNGLTKDAGNVIKLGGTLTEDTILRATSVATGFKAYQDVAFGSAIGFGDSAQFVGDGAHLAWGDYINQVDTFADAYAGANGFTMKHKNGTTGENISLSFQTSGTVFSDNRTVKMGIEYAAVGYETQPLSLVTKLWVENAIDAIPKMTIGNINSQPKSVDGAAIFGTSLFMQTADSTRPGLVDINDQTFAGVKSFAAKVDLINETGSSMLTFGKFGAFTIFGFEQGANDISIYDYTNAKHKLRIQVDNILLNESGGNVGIGISPTALLHLKAGTAGTAPLKLTSGIALTTPEDGAIEYHNSHLYFTIGTTRYQLDQQALSDGDKGDITVSGGGGIWTIDDNTIVNSKIASGAVTTIKINNGAVTNPKITNCDWSKLLNVPIFAGSAAGLVPTSVGGTANFLREDGTWAAPSGTDNASGTYTPTLTNVSNVSSSAISISQYMRVGNTVTVSGSITMTPLAAGNTVMRFNPPIASNFTNSVQVAGTIISWTGTQVGTLISDSTNNAIGVEINNTNATAYTYYWHCTYQII